MQAEGSGPRYGCLVEHPPRFSRSIASTLRSLGRPYGVRAHPFDELDEHCSLAISHRFGHRSCATGEASARKPSRPHARRPTDGFALGA
jgi:hypothetical protein